MSDNTTPAPAPERFPRRMLAAVTAHRALNNEFVAVCMFFITESTDAQPVSLLRARSDHQPVILDDLLPDYIQGEDRANLIERSTLSARKARKYSGHAYTRLPGWDVSTDMPAAVAEAEHKNQAVFYRINLFDSLSDVPAFIRGSFGALSAMPGEQGDNLVAFFLSGLSHCLASEQETDALHSDLEPWIPQNRRSQPPAITRTAWTYAYSTLQAFSDEHGGTLLPDYRATANARRVVRRVLAELSMHSSALPDSVHDYISGKTNPVRVADEPAAEPAQPTSPEEAAAPPQGDGGIIGPYATFLTTVLDAHKKLTQDLMDRGASPGDFSIQFSAQICPATGNVATAVLHEPFRPEILPVALKDLMDQD